MDRSQLLNSSEESLRLALDGRQASIWTALPGIIQSVNFSQMTVQVQPTIQGTIFLENGTTQLVNLPLLVDVPLCFPSGGGYTLTFPIAQGDEVLVIFSSRCIDAWYQYGGVQRPMEMRMHDLSDGFAIPGPKSLPHVIGSISSTHAQLRNNAGTTVFEFTSTGFKITGDLLVTGNITSNADVLAGTISLTNHIHNVTTAPGVTSAPV